MAQFRNDLGYEVIVPSLALVVPSGEVIDAPDDFVCAGFTLITDAPASKGNKTSDDAVVVPPTDAPTETPVATGDATAESTTANPEGV